MAQNWNLHVNKNFYGLDGSYTENTEEVSFKSGRTIQYLKNSTPKKQFSLNLWLNDTKSISDSSLGLKKTEFGWFLYWYENTVKSGTESFYLPDVSLRSSGNYVEYRLIDVPSWNGQADKEVTITIEEA